jgi:hypothetical protein
MLEKDLSIKIGVTKFDGSSDTFRVWKIRVVNALKADKSWIACDTMFSIAEKEKEEQNTTLDEKAKLIIMSTITDNVLRSVYKETAKEMWAALCTKYEVKDAQGINFTRRNFFNCKQENNESVASFIERVASLREELEAAEHEMKDIDSIMTIIQGISSSYEVYVQCLTVNKKASELKLEDIQNALISEEKRRHEKKKGTQDSEYGQVFYNMEKCNKEFTETREKACFNCKMAGHIARQCRFKKLKCFNCNKWGHKASYCRMPRENGKQSANTVRENGKSKQEKMFVFHIKEKEILKSVSEKKAVEIEKENPVETEIRADKNQFRQSARVKSKTKFYKPGQTATTKASKNKQISFIQCLCQKEKPNCVQKVFKNKFRDKRKESERAHEKLKRDGYSETTS